MTPGDTRLVKVLVRCADGSVDGHRAYPIAIRRRSAPHGECIVVAATDGAGFTWGHFYLCRDLRPDEHPYVIQEVTTVPRESGWELFEACVDAEAGHEDPFA